MKRIKLVLSIRSLDIGGAERQFLELVRGIDKERFDVYVCTMYPGAMDDEMKKLDNVSFYCFNKQGRYDLSFLFRYKKFLEQIGPEIIYSWLGEMNLFSYWAKPKNTKLVWSFRASNMDLSKYGKVSQFLFWLQKRYSCRVDCIIANSRAAVEYHESVGFDVSRCAVVHNGIDTLRFRSDHTLRSSFRREQGLRDDEIAIAMVARLDPMKGYEYFVQAAARLLQKYEHLRFFAVGGGDEEIKRRCEEYLEDKERFVWLGSRTDVERVYNGVDIVVSASLTEGFSNSIAEAMACGKPCVVTDVGESAFLVESSGVVVRPGDADALARGVEELLKSDRNLLGARARERIVQNFSTRTMVINTQEVLLACVE